MLDLKQPIYKQTAAYGHFGRIQMSYSMGKSQSGRIKDGEPIAMN